MNAVSFVSLVFVFSLAVADLDPAWNHALCIFILLGGKHNFTTFMHAFQCLSNEQMFQLQQDGKS